MLCCHFEGVSEVGCGLISNEAGTKLVGRGVGSLQGDDNNGISLVCSDIRGGSSDKSLGGVGELGE